MHKCNLYFLPQDVFPTKMIYADIYKYDKTIISPEQQNRYDKFYI